MHRVYRPAAKGRPSSPPPHPSCTHKQRRPLVPNVRIRKWLSNISTDHCGQDYIVARTVRHSRKTELLKVGLRIPEFSLAEENKGQE